MAATALRSIPTSPTPVFSSSSRATTMTRTARGCGRPAPTSRAASSTISTSTIIARRQVQAHETIQFLIRETDAKPLPETVPGPHITMARHAVQITSKYRPRLQEIDDEFRRRVGDTSEIVTLEGATRNPRYSSAEMVHYANRGAPPRRSGRLARNAIIIPDPQDRRLVAEEHARAALLFLSARRSRQRQSR